MLTDRREACGFLLRLAGRIAAQSVLLFIAATVVGHAQPAPGGNFPASSLQIRVVDASGAPIPGARFEIDGVTVEARTDSEGNYAIPQRPNNARRIRIEAPGFASSTLAIDGSTLHVTLEVNHLSTTMEVSARVADLSGSVSKLNVRLLETPQAISVVSREQMTAQAPQTMQEALRYVPGVRAEQYGFDSRGDWASIRGGSFGQFVNGQRMLFGSYNNIRPEPFALEQIEVIRGPSSVMFGQGGFGGVINLVTKRPLPVPRGEVAVQIGSFGRKQIGVDLTGPADTEGKLLYRFVGVARDSNTQVNFVPDDRLLVAPAITWKPREGTRITLLGNFQEDRMGSSVGFYPWRGTLQPHPLGRIHPGTFISEPGFDEYLSSQRSGGYLLEHRFAGRWTLRQNANYSNSRVSYQTLYSAFAPRPGFNADDRTINRVIYINRPTANTPTIDTHVETRFRTGFVNHTFLAGHDFQQAAITGTTAFANSTPIDVFAPVYGNYTIPRLNPIAKSRQRQNGIYAQDQIKFGEHWSAMLGIRKDWASAETAGNAASRLDTTAITGRAGIVYATRFGLAPYASYTESFLPLAGFDLFNNPFRPQRAKQWETGVKYEPGGGRVLLNVALFDLRETNRRTPDPVNPGNSIQVGEVRSRGAELEARAKLPHGVDVISSYSHNLARVSRSNSTDLGKRLPTMPLHLGSVWVVKQWQVTRSARLTVGPGIRYTGSTFDGMDTLRTPSYTLVDGLVSWDTTRWRFAINAANAADNIHLTACLSRGDCFYGSRRNIMASVHYKF